MMNGGRRQNRQSSTPFQRWLGNDGFSSSVCGRMIGGAEAKRWPRGVRQDHQGDELVKGRLAIDVTGGAEAAVYAPRREALLRNFGY